MSLAKELANNEKFRLHRMSPIAVELLKIAAAANQVEAWDVTQKRWLRSIFGKFNIDDPELIYRATESWIRENLKLEDKNVIFIKRTKEDDVEKELFTITDNMANELRNKCNILFKNMSQTARDAIKYIHKNMVGHVYIRYVKATAMFDESGALNLDRARVEVTERPITNQNYNKFPNDCIFRVSEEALKRYAALKFVEREYKVRPCGITGKYYVCLGQRNEPLVDHLFSNRFINITYSKNGIAYIRKYWTVDHGEPVAITLCESR